MKQHGIEQKIADIATNKKEHLQGFKILGLFPFYLSYVRTSTHIRLVALRSQIQAVTGIENSINDFYNSEILQKAQPLINEFCVTGLINSRGLGWLLKPFIRRKIKQCSHRQVLSIYTKLIELSDGGFFLTYWTHLMIKNHTVLKTEKA